MMIWKKAHDWLKLDQKLWLLYVIESKGSSPGRVGFKMIINQDGEMSGSIGGGFMEHKLVELCKNELSTKKQDPFFKRQIHKTNIPKDKSGMICSGEQSIAFYQLEKSHLPMISGILKAISNTKNGVLTATEKGISFNNDEKLSQKFDVDISSKDSWSMKEDVRHFQELHIIGGGHVGLALSKFASEMGFLVKIYDDRENLNTVEQNSYAEFVYVPDYAHFGNYITDGANKYVVLMSFGYRTDKTILGQILDHNFKYLGMMGSKEKVKKLFEEMVAEGISKEKLDNVYSPVGIQISSQTPEEIAVSVLAEIIQIKNAS